MKPDDIPQRAWDEAEHALVYAYVDHHKDYNPMSNSISVGLWDKFTETFARAILQARSQAYEEAKKAMEPAVVYFERYCQDEAEDVENCVCGGQQHEDAKAFAQAIHQHSQKGEDNE